MSKAESNIGYEDIAALLAGECSPGREAEIRQWINASAENKKFYRDCEEIFILRYDVPESTQSFDKNSAWEKVRIRINPEESEIDAVTSWPTLKWLRVAAVITLLISAVFLIWRPFSAPVQLVAETGIKEFYLPDSSRIVLRGESTVTYNAGFNDHHRTVQLQGEAFFDVTSRPTMPFIIQTPAATVRVVGTAFLVKVDTDSVLVEVERGKVELFSKDNDASVLLTKNERGTLQISQGSIRKVELRNSNQLYWATATLSYTRKPLADVFDELQQQFGKKIIYDQQGIQQCRISGIFKGQKFEEIMKNISLAMQFTYQLNGDTVQVQSEGCE